VNFFAVHLAEIMSGPVPHYRTSPPAGKMWGMKIAVCAVGLVLALCSAVAYLTSNVAFV
jgi:hypothetical protein